MKIADVAVGERPPASADARALAPEWRVWIVEQLARGHLARDIALHLSAHGIDKELVDREVASLAPAGPLAHTARLRRMLGRTIPERHAPQAAADFWTYHWEGNLPLVVRGYARAWPASQRWTFEHLRERFGDATLSVEVERDPSRHFEGRWVETTLGAFVGDLATRPGNDRYAIARNENLRRPALASLFEDVVVDEVLFDRARLAGGSSLWLGPAGTLTPLHFDTTNILFVQVRGKKRFDLVSPDLVELVLHLDGFYVDGDLARVDPDERHTITLEAGDALFIPVGWMHRVEALDPSISFSLLCFRRHNDFSRLAPPLHPIGAPRRVGNRLVR